MWRLTNRDELCNDVTKEPSSEPRNKPIVKCEQQNQKGIKGLPVRHAGLILYPPEQFLNKRIEVES